MTTLIVKVDDESTESLKKILEEMSYVHGVAIENDKNILQEPTAQYKKIKQILDEAKGKNLFADIMDPVEWQREIRKEWDRDI